MTKEAIKTKYNGWNMCMSMGYHTKRNENSIDKTISDIAWNLLR